MATIKLGGGVTDIRGSIGGNTFSRCAGGAYIRARVKPVNPHSVLQSARRAQVAYLSTYWSKTLTDQQRIDWRAYAAGTTWTNRLGDVITINGLAAFLRANLLRATAGVAPVASAPTAMGHAGGVEFTFTAYTDTSKINIAEPTGAFDKDTDAHSLYLFQGLPTEPGRLSTPAGMKYLGNVYGHSVSPLVFPYALDSEYTMTIGQRITVRGMYKDAEGRVSGPFLATALAEVAPE